mgnify:CR=1 FL=1
MKNKRKISATKLVQSQGLGSRKDIVKSIQAGALKIDDLIIDSPTTLIDRSVLGFEWNSKYHFFMEKVLIIMNKQSGFECSHKPTHHSSVFELLPQEYINREVQCVGRLDVDTSGLLLLTDDGDINHKFCSPKSHLEKEYHLRCEDTLDQTIVDQLIEGVELKSEKGIFKAKRAELKQDGSIAMVITEGKYHQVKRMLGATGHRVNYLHRMSMGDLTCEGLKPGEWRVIDASTCFSE